MVFTELASLRAPVPALLASLSVAVNPLVIFTALHKLVGRAASGIGTCTAPLVPLARPPKVSHSSSGTRFGLEVSLLVSRGLAGPALRERSGSFRQLSEQPFLLLWSLQLLILVG